jgi:hypothetical protein
MLVHQKYEYSFTQTSSAKAVGWTGAAMAANIFVGSTGAVKAVKEHPRLKSKRQWLRTSVAEPERQCCEHRRL